VPSAVTSPTTSSATTAPSATKGGSAVDQATRKVARAQPRFGPTSDVPQVKGGDNSIQNYGSEASGSDRLAAARILTSYLSSISAGNAKTACALLATSATEQMQQVGANPAGGSAGCPALVGRIVSNLPAELKHQLADVRVLSVRVDGEHGFIIFDGVGPKVANMPLVKESGGWRVAAIGPIPLQY
jgi:hypothetical protein